jgi:hypothetical protein
MKRIAALAAIVITMIAVPAAAAMASTSDSGPGYGSPGPVQVACHPGYGNAQYKLPAYTQAYPWRHRHGEPIRTVCPFIPAKPLPVGCQPQQVVFNAAAGSSTLTEVSGPVLSPAEAFSYGGSSYTITSVNPGADSSFTVSNGGWLFHNQGRAITDGVGLMGCSN